MGAVRLMPEKEEDGTVQKGVFFPGTGWSHREELMVILSSRLAKEDISILPVDWTDAIPFRPIETVDQAVDISLGFAICALMGTELPEHPLVISKSLGCHTAGRWSHLMNVSASHILLTPPADCLCGFDDRQKILAAVAGEKDSVVPVHELEDWAKKRNIPLFVLPGLDHSLKAGKEACEDLAGRLTEVLDRS